MSAHFEVDGFDQIREDLNPSTAILYPEPYQHGMLNLSPRWVPPEIRRDEAAWVIHSLPHEPEVGMGKLPCR